MKLDLSSPIKQSLQSRRYTIWRLIFSYWQSEYRTAATLFAVVILAMTMMLVGVDVILTIWSGYFYDALQQYNLHSVIMLVFAFCVIVSFAVIIQVYRFYLQQVFGLKWRRWLTEQLIGLWLQKHGYYYLENFDIKTDNPDQRIQEDAAALVSNSIDLSVGLVGACTTVPAFIYILWVLSGVLDISLGPLGTLSIHGYLVWIAVIYNLIGTFITFKIGRPLVNLNFEQQRREATFRFSAIDLRSHAEQVALLKGESHQKEILDFHFRNVLENYYAIVLRQKLLLWFVGSFNQISVILPLISALPNYFRKVFLLGGVQKSMRAFANIQDSLSYLINAYTQIAQWRAIGQRLTTFINHLYESEIKAEKENQVIVKKQSQNKIITKEMTIKTARGETLLKNIDETFVHGKSYVIKGESGLGKSTFIRTLAGIWPYASGEVIFPQNKQIMYLPQKPYMPIGTLSEAILFPDKNDPAMEKNIEKILHDCNLEMFIPRLHETAKWSEQLSPGEQQRISFARVLLHKPDWVFLDESTSMLDLANEARLYKVLRQRLPHCTIVSVGHHPSVDEFHEEKVRMEKYKV